MQFAEAEQWARARACTLTEAASEVFHRTLPDELKKKLEQKNLGLDYRTLDRAVAKGGDIKYMDFRKDWSPHFKRLCIMPDGRLIETGGLEEFAQLHQITVPQAKRLVEEGGTLEVGGEVLACQIVNGQPAVARFSAKNYVKAKELVAEQRAPSHGCAERSGVQRSRDDEKSAAKRPWRTDVARTIHTSLLRRPNLLPAELFSCGRLDVLPVRLRRPHLREVPAGFGLERRATGFMNNPGYFVGETFVLQALRSSSRRRTYETQPGYLYRGAGSRRLFGA